MLYLTDLDSDVGHNIAEVEIYGSGKCLVTFPTAHSLVVINHYNYGPYCTIQIAACFKLNFSMQTSKTLKKYANKS